MVTSSLEVGTPEGDQLPEVFHSPDAPPDQVLVAAWAGEGRRNKIKITRNK